MRLRGIAAAASVLLISGLALPSTAVSPASITVNEGSGAACRLTLLHGATLSVPTKPGDPQSPEVGGLAVLKELRSPRLAWGYVHLGFATAGVVTLPLVRDRVVLPAGEYLFVRLGNSRSPQVIPVTGDRSYRCTADGASPVQQHFAATASAAAHSWDYETAAPSSGSFFLVQGLAAAGLAQQAVRVAACTGPASSCRADCAHTATRGQLVMLSPGASYASYRFGQAAFHVDVGKSKDVFAGCVLGAGVSSVSSAYLVLAGKAISRR